MNRFALIAVTGFLALALTACGGHEKQNEAPAADSTVQQPAPQQPDQGQHH